MAHKQHPADALTEQYQKTEYALHARTRRWQLVLLSLCGALLVTFGAALYLSPPQSFSPEENRVLTTAPTLTLEALLDGTLTRTLSDFYADQFPLRSLFIRAKAGTELSLGKQENGDVLRGKDGYLISRLEYTEQNRAYLAQNLAAVSQWEAAMHDSAIPFTVAVVPRSIDVNLEKLPLLYDPENANAAWSWLSGLTAEHDLSVTVLTESLRQAAKEGETVWFRTDHHWTPLGAYYAYVALSEQLGYEPYPLSSFTAEVVCDSFYGTTYASSGMHWLSGEPLTLMRYEGDDRYLTEIIEGDSVIRMLPGLYDMDALQTHDEYNVFLGGTNTHVRVIDPTATDRPRLVLLKDSFSQSLAPYLARHFDLVLIDPRTYKNAAGSLYDLITSYEPDHVLLLYGIDTLCQSPSLRTLRTLTYALERPGN